MSQSPYPAVASGPPRPSLILRPGQIALPPGMTSADLKVKKAGALPYLTLIAGVAVMLIANWLFVI